MTIHKGQFSSVWAEGTVQTKGTYDDNTGEVTCKSVEIRDLGALEREYFEYKNQKHQACEVEVCTTCHSFILKTVMIPGAGHTLIESKVCTGEFTECPHE